MIVEAVIEGVTHFEIGRRTCLMVDWSKKGIGFLLLQKWCTCDEIHPRCCVDGWRLTLAGGRFTTPAESRYSPIEGECLAVRDSLHKAKLFVMGCPDLLVATDHKPLVGLFDKQFSEIQNPRLLALVENTMWFKFNMIHVQGKINSGPDYMSRTGKTQGSLQFASVTCYIGSEDNREDQSIDDSISMMLVGALQNDNKLRTVTLDAVRDATKRDEILDKLQNILLESEGAEMLLPADLSDYNRYRDRLSVLDGCLMYGNRLVIPKELRHEVLSHLHSAHQGVEGMLSRAKQTVFWPGLYSDLEKLRARCRECHVRAPSQPALPPHPIASPDYPFQQITADYCTIKSKTWLIIADRFSGWTSAFYFSGEASSNDLIKILRDMFTTFGAAEEISTDAGSQFMSHSFRDFLKRWGVSHRVSSEYNPHSNMRAESSVKTSKRALMTATRSDGSPNWDMVARAFLQHRNTPIKDIGFSPAQLVFGHPIRDMIPVKKNSYKPSDVWVNCRQQRELALRHKVVKKRKDGMHIRDLYQR